MIDGIIKADGTSRLMRANLPATYDEFKAQAAAGTLPLDVLFNADGWSQLPTFLNKFNLLKDGTSSLFGLSASSVPDDVFDWIGQYNTHWWSRYSDKSYYEVAIGEAYPYASGYSKNNVIIYDYSTLSKTNPITIKTADSVAVDAAGNISLTNPTTYTDDATDWEFAYHFESSWLGKYCQVSVATASLSANEIFYVPSNAAFYYYAKEVGASVVYKVVSRLISAGKTTYVHAIDRNAYPDSGTVDGLTYQYLGIPFQNAVTSPKIATGSYTGTGAVGPSAPNAITFDKEPFLVLLLGSINQAGTVNTLIASGADSVVAKFVPQFWGTEYKQGLGLGLNTNGTLWGKKSADGKTFYWYHGNPSGGAVSSDSPGNQANTSGLTYYYAAIFE